MVRISDILKFKKKSEAEQPELPASGAPQKQEAVSQPLAPSAKEEPPKSGETGILPSPEPGIRISETVMSKSKMLDKEECVNLYKQAVGLVQEIYEKTRVGREITEGDLKNANAYAEKFVDQQSLDNDNILSLLRLPRGEFIYGRHAVNVCIICIDLSIGIGYDRNKLMELGTITLLHDTGMERYHDLYNQPRRLIEREIAEIKNHPKISAEILEKFGNLYRRASSVIYQEHERVDGSGYPNGLKEETIHEYAKIIGLADMYEALTHTRPYRGAFDPRDALNIILENKNAFGRKIMKVLIERLACPFPVGSNIKLSSGEKGKVIKRNLACSLRPVVEIISAANGENLEKSRTINLSKHPTIFIKDTLKDDKA